MEIYWLYFPEVQPRPCGRPKSCPYCRSQLLQGWGRSKKTVHDGDEREAEVRRFRCCECGRTFRRYPDGVARGTRSQRLKSLAAVVWSLGLSVDGMLALFDRFGLSGSRTSLWRDAREIADGLRAGRPAEEITLRNLAEIEGERSPGTGWHGEDIMLVLDLEGQGRIALGISHENGHRDLTEWLKYLAEALDIELVPVRRAN